MQAQSAVYDKIQAAYQFTDFEMQKLNFTVTVIKYEFSKIILLGTVFGILGYFTEYAILMLTLIPVRMFSGGIHFNHYSSCFLFTSLFSALPILLTGIVLPHPVQLAILALCTVITYVTGPVTSTKRPPVRYARYCIFRLVSTGVVLMWFFIFAFAGAFPYQNLCFWVIALQTIQLICAKIARKGDIIYEKD